jgi:hypothetical protein
MSELRCSKTFQKQKGTNRGVPKISGAKRNKKVFQSFLGPKKSKCSKNLQIKGQQTGSIVIKQQKNLEKRRLIFFHEDKIEGIR